LSESTKTDIGLDLHMPLVKLTVSPVVICWRQIAIAQA